MPDETPTLAQIVAALEVTYKDPGVVIWLTGTHRDGMRPLQLISDGRIDEVAEKVRRIDGIDPAGFTITEARSER